MTEVATWIIENRQIKAVGTDTASFDVGKSIGLAALVTIITHNSRAFENVANFHELPALGICVLALPIKICGGSGGPLRVVVKVYDDIR